MPSPFPGMNPFLEQEDTWKDFHDTFLIFLRDALAARVQPSFIVKVGEYLFIHEPPAEQRFLFGHGDVTFARPHASAAGATVTAAASTTSPARVRIPSVNIEEHIFLEIRDRDNRELVTVLEMLSPSNKRPGPDREQYLGKRASILHSSANFVELDFLRGWPKMPVENAVACDYSILISRAEERPEAGYWPLRLRDRLPIVPIPLRTPHADVEIDLQEVLHRVFDSAQYQHYLYANQPNPPLDTDDATWAASLLRT